MTPFTIIATVRTLTIVALLGAIPVVSLAGDDAKVDPAGKLVVNSAWQGVQQHKGHARTKPASARLKVTQRDNDKLKGEFWLTERGGKRGVKVDGVVDGKSGSLTLKPYEIISGAWGSDNLLEETWPGTVADTRLAFQRKTQRGTWDVNLTLKTKDER